MEASNLIIRIYEKNIKDKLFGSPPNPIDGDISYQLT